ncbi:c-type cytochrome [Frigidibacter oleivorans]|uniref:c-type cytochrome n=1 Tax=Frigidibacter oleivorans TaxID=2487129 RepID=UPI000F8D4C61|nr:cytochrome c [Frigidibacter oleivorans]
MLRRLLTLLVLIAAIVALGLWITRPQTVERADLAGITGDAARGEAVFHAGGCASCHVAPEAVGGSGESAPVLSGGQRFVTEFGTFVAPNISPHPQAGIGGWSFGDLANAMTLGTSPGGQHYYPAFPYASYAKATLQDVADLHAYLMTLPPADTPSAPHELSFPFDRRQVLGGWKMLYLDRDWVVAGDLTPEEERGRYLVEALGHCGECHTPRDSLGGMDRDRWLAGAPLEGGGRVPNITPAGLDWSVEEIAEYLNSGFTPDFDSAGGHMALVVANFAQLPPEDRLAVAAYLKRVPGVE